MVDPVGRRWALLPAATLVLLMAAPSALSQSPPAVTDLAASISIPPTMVGDDPQGIPLVGTASNHGQAAVAAFVSMDVRDGGRYGTQHLLASTPVTLQAGQSSDFTVTWNGHADSGPDATDWNSASHRDLMAGPLTFTFSVQPASTQVADSTPADNVASAAGRLIIHAFTLASAPSPGATIDPGSTGVQIVTLTNTGSDDDAAQLSVAPTPVSSTDATAKTPGWAFQLASTTASVPAGGSKSITLSVTPPSGAPPGSTGLFTVSAASQSKGLGSVMLDGTTAPASSAGLLQIQVPDPVTVDPGQTPAWDIVVKDRRSQPMQVTLQAGAQSDGALPHLAFAASTLSFGGNDQQTVHVTLASPILATQAAETATWALTATSDVAGATPTTATLTGSIRTIHKMQMAVAAAPTDLVPGAEAAYTFNIQNQGNARTVFQVIATNLPATWTTVPGEPQQLDIEQTRAFTVKLTPPTDAPAGPFPSGLTFRGFSTAIGDAVPTHQDKTVAAQVLARGHPDLSALDDRLPVAGGQTVHFAVTLANHGNEAGTYAVGRAIGSASPPNWDVQVSPAGPVQLAPGAEQGLDVAVRAPDGTLPADAHLTATVQVRPSGDPNFGQADLELRAMPAIADLAAGAPSATPSVFYAGSPAVLHVAVANAGTKATEPGATLKVVLRPASSTTDWLSFDRDLPVLDWHGDDTLHFDFTLPLANLPSGTTQLVALASLDNHGKFAEAATANNQATTTFEVRPFSLDAQGPGDRLAKPGQTLHYSADTAFTVTNKGTTPEAVVLSATMERPWAQFTPLQVTIDAGKSVAYGGDVLVPALPGVGVANLTLHVASATAQGVERTLLVRVLLDDSFPPAIDSLAASDAVVGAPTSFTARVVDASGVRSATLVIAFPAGRIVQVPMVAGAAGAYAASYNFTEAGAYTWYVAADDSTARHNAADTAGQPRALTVRPDRGFALRLVTPTQAGPLRPGTDLTLAADGARRLVHADYAVDGAAVPLTPDTVLRIPTDGWPDGPRTLTVHAEDEAGARATATYAFTVDGTPPTIDAIDTRASGGGVEVTATVEDATGVRAVELRYTTSSGEGGIAPMEDRGNHTYSTVLALPGKVRTLTFVLEDTLGNQGIDPRSPGGLLAAGSQGSPAPALLGAALALLAVAALRRRSA